MAVAPRMRVWDGAVSAQGPDRWSDGSVWFGWAFRLAEGGRAFRSGLQPGEVEEDVGDHVVEGWLRSRS